MGLGLRGAIWPVLMCFCLIITCNMGNTKAKRRLSSKQFFSDWWNGLTDNGSYIRSLSWRVTAPC